ncbi:hypothetical protein GDO86_003437 [Hymenochirus boettgeri]|uniref:Uncharacterized protein n=1 Tax=Hymenochirus boettgeri TaxID=247094 RepID=A0A8T2K1E0_9PIPI|nr:hypothetical protein GDO86_003437 [Hymenochirus boettgeri]
MAAIWKLAQRVAIQQLLPIRRYGVAVPALQPILLTHPNLLFLLAPISHHVLTMMHLPLLVTNSGNCLWLPWYQSINLTHCECATDRYSCMRKHFTLQMHTEDPRPQRCSVACVH